MIDASFSSCTAPRRWRIPTWNIIKNLCTPTEDVVHSPHKSNAVQASINILVALALLALHPRKGAQYRGGALVTDVRHRDILYSGAGGSWAWVWAWAWQRTIQFDMIRYDTTGVRSCIASVLPSTVVKL